MKNVPMPVAVAVIVVAVLLVFLAVRRATTPAAPEPAAGPPHSYIDQYRSSGQPGPGR